MRIRQDGRTSRWGGRKAFLQCSDADAVQAAGDLVASSDSDPSGEADLLGLVLARWQIWNALAVCPEYPIGLRQQSSRTGAVEHGHCEPALPARHRVICAVPKAVPSANSPRNKVAGGLTPVEGTRQLLSSPA